MTAPEARHAHAPARDPAPRAARARRADGRASRRQASTICSISIAWRLSTSQCPRDGSIGVQTAIRSTSDDRLEHARRRVLPDLVPLEVLPVHRDVDAGRQHLRERQRAAEVEQSVRTAEGVRESSRRSARWSCRSRPAASAPAVSTIVSVPCVMTMRDSSALRAVADDQLAIGVGHVEAVDHHQRANRHGDARPPELEHLATGACRRTSAARGSRRRSCRTCRR